MWIMHNINLLYKLHTAGQLLSVVSSVVSCQSVAAAVVAPSGQQILTVVAKETLTEAVFVQSQTSRLS